MHQNSAHSLYIHIPFCLHRCGYCDFNTFAGKLQLRPAYVAALENEILSLQQRFVLDKNTEPALQTIYFGGGTPSLLEAEELGRILNRIKDVWRIAEGAEITLEMNPGTFRAGYFNEILALGINRLSIGLQSLDDDLLRRLDRVHNREQFCTCLAEAKQAGFKNISVDLMIGLPGQSKKQIQESMAYLVQSDIPHLSVYSLIIEEETPFFELYGPRGRCSILLPSEEEEREMHHYVCDYLAAFGLKQYEVSNFAKPGFESKHNLVYWNAKQYYALGAGAHSFIGGERRGSIFSPEEYIAAFSLPFSAQQNNVFNKACIVNQLWPLEEIVSEEESKKEFFLLGLRQNSGVTEKEFIRRFGQKIPAALLNSLKECQRQRLLAHKDGRWFLTELGHDLANQVFQHFV